MKHKMFFPLIILSLLLTSCGGEPASTNPLSLDAKEIVFTDMTGGQGRSTEYKSSDPDFIAEFCGFIGHQAYTPPESRWNSDYEVKLLDGGGETILGMTLGARAVTFDRDYVIGKTEFKAGVTYETQQWISDYMSEFCTGSVLSPVDTGCTAKVELPADDFSAGIINRGSSTVNNYETLPRLYDFIEKYVSGRDFEIVGSERVYDFSSMDSLTAETEKENKCILINYYSSQTYMNISSTHNYAELARAYPLVLCGCPGRAGEYELITSDMILRIKVDDDFDGGFRQLFAGEGNTRKVLTPVEIQSIFASKKPYYMEYICKNLGMDNWNMRPDDSLTSEKMKLNGGEPYTVLRLSNAFNTRLLIFKGGGENWKFIDSINFGGRSVVDTDIHLEKGSGRTWIVGNNCRGHGTGEDRYYQEWYLVTDEGKSLVLSFPYDDFTVPPWGGYDITADSIRTTDGSPFSVCVGFGVRMIYLIGIDSSDEYGQVEVTGKKSVTFTWDDSAGRFVSEYAPDESGMTIVPPECEDIAKKCGDLLYKNYDMLLADINSLDAEENEMNAGFRARGLEYFLNDCPDSDKKAGLLKLLKDKYPDLA